MKVTECTWNNCKSTKSVPLVRSSSSDYHGYDGWVQAVNIHNGVTLYMKKGINNTANMVLLGEGVKYTTLGKAVGKYSFEANITLLVQTWLSLGEKMPQGKVMAVQFFTPNIHHLVTNENYMNPGKALGVLSSTPFMALLVRGVKEYGTGRSCD